LFQLTKSSDAVTVGDPRVDRRGADGLVAEMVLNELERETGVQEMRGDGMPQRMNREVPRETRQVAVPAEEILNLALLEWPASAAEERGFRVVGWRPEVLDQESGRSDEQGTLRPRAALEASDNDALTFEVNIATLKKRDFPDAQAVVVDQREQRTIPVRLKRTKEGLSFRLSQVARQSVSWQAGIGQREKLFDP
jgi:hypothetical protein